ARLPAGALPRIPDPWRPVSPDRRPSCAPPDPAPRPGCGDNRRKTAQAYKPSDHPLIEIGSPLPNAGAYVSTVREARPRLWIRVASMEGSDGCSVFSTGVRDTL